MRKKIMFIINPYAGRGQLKNDLFELVEQFSANGYNVSVFPTREEYSIQQMLTDHMHEHDIVVCAGGDGTLNLTIDAMMNLPNKKPLGYIPSGTTNDFAATLGLPSNSLDAVDTILQQKIEFCDIGSFNQKYFTYIAAFGAFTDVSYNTSQQAKNLFGRTAYIVAGAKRLPSLHSYRLRIKANGKIVEDDFIYGAITNSTSVGGFASGWLPDIQLNDGLFEALFIKMPTGPLSLHATAASLLKHKINKRQMYYFKTPYLEITALGETPWTLDGEYGGSPETVIIENHKRAIPLFVSHETNVFPITR